MVHKMALEVHMMYEVDKSGWWLPLVALGLRQTSVVYTEVAADPMENQCWSECMMRVAYILGPFEAHRAWAVNFGENQVLVSPAPDMFLDNRQMVYPRKSF